MTTVQFALGGLVQWVGLVFALGAAVGACLATVYTLAAALSQRQIGPRAAPEAPSEGGTSPGTNEQPSAVAVLAHWLCLFGCPLSLVLAGLISIWPLRLNALCLLMPLDRDVAFASGAAPDLAGALMVGFPSGLVSWWLLSRVTKRPGGR